MTQKSRPTAYRFNKSHHINGEPVVSAGHRFRQSSTAAQRTHITPTSSSATLSDKKNVMLRLSIIIPVYNEEETLEEIVQRVRAVDLSGFVSGSSSSTSDDDREMSSVSFERELVLVDDGSTDGTHAILHRWQNEAPSDMRIIFHKENSGKGAALRTGFQHATGDILVIQDADLEYDPRDYSKLIQPIVEGTTDVVYGSRFLGGPRTAMTMSHMLGNKGVTLIMNLVYGTVLSDMETCYKCFRREVVQDLTLNSRRFDIEPEITAKILKQGHTIFEVPIRYHGRAFHEGKKLTWRDGFNAVWTILKYRFVD